MMTMIDGDDDDDDDDNDDDDHDDDHHHKHNEVLMLCQAQSCIQGVLLLIRHKGLTEATMARNDIIRTLHD